MIASGIVSAGVGFYFNSFGCALVSFLAGSLIDLDHLFDYYSNRKFTLNMGDIYKACADMTLNRIYIWLHSYELLFLLWLAIYIFRLSNLWMALAIGITQHMIIDQLTNPLNNLGYFLTYRLLRDFKKEFLVKGDHGQT